jgi:cytochrome b
MQENRMTTTSAPRQSTPSSPARVRVWDLPTRLFHWTLALVVLGSFISAKVGGSLMVWHERLGCTALALLLFRLIWGFAGGRYARFSAFVRGPATITAYLTGRWQGLGHNPLSALSVLAMLAALGFQAVSGLFTNDDIAFEGPLASRVSGKMSALLTTLHRGNETVILALIALHIAAILFYRIAKRRDLVGPMLHGDAPGLPGEMPSRDDLSLRLRALVLAALCAGAVAWLVRS